MAEQGPKLKKREHGVVVAFRMDTKSHEKIKTVMKSTPVPGIKSHGEFVRKVMIDYLSGRLVYTLPDFQRQNPMLGLARQG